MQSTYPPKHPPFKDRPTGPHCLGAASDTDSGVWRGFSQENGKVNVPQGHSSASCRAMNKDATLPWKDPCVRTSCRTKPAAKTRRTSSSRDQGKPRPFILRSSSWISERRRHRCRVAPEAREVPARPRHPSAARCRARSCSHHPPPASQWKPVSSAEQLVGWTKASTICPQHVLQMCHCGAHSLARAGGRRGLPQPQDLAAG